MFGFLKKNAKQDGVKVTEFDLFAVADGELIPIEQVNDPVFSQKMMGEGFAVKPTGSSVVAPAAGEVMNIFPSKHALALKQGDVEILMHLGIDTVNLEGKPFTTLIEEGASVEGGQGLEEVDLAAIEAAGLDSVMMVVFTNSTETVASLEIFNYGPVRKGDCIGKVILK